MIEYTVDVTFGYICYKRTSGKAARLYSIYKSVHYDDLTTTSSII